MSAPGPMLAVVAPGGAVEWGLLAHALCGLPLIGHALRCASACPDVGRVVAITDDPDAARAAASLGTVVLRPPAASAGGAWAGVRLALDVVESETGGAVAFVALLDPRTLGGLPDDLSAALRSLRAAPEADGIVGVSRPEFNPIWHCVVEREGWMADLVPDGARYNRRQEVPVVYRMTGALAIWSREFARREAGDWRRGRLLMHEVPDWRTIHITGREDLAVADALLRNGYLRLPWVSPP